MIANSSPPRRATRSDARDCCCSRRAGHALEFLLKATSVEEARQCIVVGEILQLTLVALLVGHVLEND
jgi:hypothetical protein